MTAANMQAQPRKAKVKYQDLFRNNHFYLEFSSKARLVKAAELVQTFGGIIEDFLEPAPKTNLLTDIDKSEWDDTNKHKTLQRARAFGIRILSYNWLADFCSRYVNSQSSGDEDDAIKVQSTEPRAPYIKYEDFRQEYRPTFKEFLEWPKVNITDKLACGQSIFSIAQLSTQPPTPRPTNCTNTKQSSTQQMLNVRRPLRRVTCELCGLKFEQSDKIEEHLESQEHKAKVAETKWDDVISVIDSLPSIDTLVTPKRAQPDNYEDDRESFVCLHKLETIDRLFQVNTPS